jgi:hypothetical protein
MPEESVVDDLPADPEEAARQLVRELYELCGESFEEGPARQARVGGPVRYAGDYPVKQLGEHGHSLAPIVIHPRGTDAGVRAVHAILHGNTMALEHVASLVGAPDASQVRLLENPDFGERPHSKRGWAFSSSIRTSAGWCGAT